MFFSHLSIGRKLEMYQKQIAQLVVAWYHTADVASWHRDNYIGRFTSGMVPKEWDIQQEPGLVSGSLNPVDSDSEDIVGWSWIWKMGSETDTWEECTHAANGNKRRNAR